MKRFFSMVLSLMIMFCAFVPKNVITVNADIIPGTDVPIDPQTNGIVIDNIEVEEITEEKEIREAEQLESEKVPDGAVWLKVTIHGHSNLPVAIESPSFHYDFHTEKTNFSYDDYDNCESKNIAWLPNIVGDVIEPADTFTATDYAWFSSRSLIPSYVHVSTIIASCTNDLMLAAHPQTCPLFCTDSNDIYGEQHRNGIAGNVMQIALPDFGEDCEEYYIAVLYTDGTVAAVRGDSFDKGYFPGWTNVVKVWTGAHGLVALKDDDTAVSDYIDLSSWENIKDIVLFDDSALGICNDGTVVAAGNFFDDPENEFDFSNWKNIEQIVVRYNIAVGRKSDGKAVITGYGTNYSESDEFAHNVNGWKNVTQLVNGWNSICGITKSGQILQTNADAEFKEHDFTDWEKITKLLPGHIGELFYGLTADGHVMESVVADTNHQLDGFKNIIDIAVGGVTEIIGLNKDGVIVFEDDENTSFKDRNDIAEWKNIKKLVCHPEYLSTVALKNDGTAKSLGDTDLIDCWTNLADVFVFQDLIIGLTEEGRILCNKENVNISALNEDSVQEGLPQDFPNGDILAAGAYHTVYIRQDGTVGAVGRTSDDRCKVDSWQDIIAVDASSHTVGLKADGTVVATGPNKKKQCNVSEWEDIVAIAAGGEHTVGLKSDGTVVAVGNSAKKQLKVDSWQDITAIDAGRATTYGLKSDGTVIAAGSNSSGQAKVTKWADITAISAGDRHVVGLMSDGTVVAAGGNSFGECDVEDWTDIVAVAAGNQFTIGLKSDGTVVATGSNKEGQCDVSDWTDIVAISAGMHHVVGIRADGRYITAGSNGYDQCDLK